MASARWPPRTRIQAWNRPSRTLLVGPPEPRGPTGALTAPEVFRRLLDGVEPDLVDQAEKPLIGTPGVLGIGSIQLRWIGRQLRADASIDVDPRLDLGDAHDIAHLAHDELRSNVPKLTDATVHDSPATIEAALGH